MDDKLSCFIYYSHLFIFLASISGLFKFWYSDHNQLISFFDHLLVKTNLFRWSQIFLKTTKYNETTGIDINIVTCRYAKNKINISSILNLRDKKLNRLQIADDCFHYFSLISSILSCMPRISHLKVFIQTTGIGNSQWTLNILWLFFIKFFCHFLYRLQED